MPSALENATLALRQPNFQDFFKHLAQVESAYQQGALIEQAISIAKQQESIDILKILAEKSVALSKDYYLDLLSDIVKILLEFEKSSADDAAISLAVIYTSDRASHQTSLWMMICETFLTRGTINIVEKLYAYLEESDKQTIADGILQNISLAQNAQHWFVWFSKYLTTASYVYYSSKSTFETQAIEFLVKTENFSQYLPYIVLSAKDRIYTDFLIDLFFALLNNKEKNKIELLLGKIPDSLAWLQQVKQAVLIDNSFGVFNRDEFDYQIEVEPLFTLMVNEFLSRSDNVSPSELVSQFLQQIEKVNFRHKKMIALELCQQCCSNQRQEIALIMLKHEALASLLKPICKLLLPTKVATEEDYRFIASRLDCWPDDISVVDRINKVKREHKPYQLDCTSNTAEVLMILSYIPSSVIHAEDAYRKEVVANKQAQHRQELESLSDNSVSQKHHLYDDVCKQIDLAIKERKPIEAQRWVKKIVSSKYRDNFLKQIVVLLLEHNQQNRLKEVCGLFLIEDKHWKELSNHINSRKHHKVLTWLLEGDFNELKLIIKYYVEKIFSENERSVALEILFNSGLFADGKLKLEEYYHLSENIDNYAAHVSIEGKDNDTDEDSDIISVTSGNEGFSSTQSLPELVIVHFITHYADSKKLCKKMTDLKERKITGFEPSILFYHLRRKQWSRAVQLINLFIGQEAEDATSIYSLKYSKHLPLIQQIVIDYFINTSTLNKDSLNKIKQINNAYLRAYVLFSLLKKKNSIADESAYHAIVVFISEQPKREHVYELICQLFDQFKRPYSNVIFKFMQHVVVQYVKDQVIKKNLYLMYIFQNLLMDPKAILEKESVRYWAEHEPFWYNMSVQINLKGKRTAAEALNLLQYFIKHSTEWKPLIHSNVSHIVFASINLMIEECANDHSSLLQASSELFLFIDDYTMLDLYITCLKKLVAMPQLSDQQGVNTLQQLERAYPVENQTKNIPAWRLRPFAESLLTHSLSVNKEHYIRASFNFLFDRVIIAIDASITTLHQAISSLIKAKNISLACEFVLKILTKYQSLYVRGPISKNINELCSYWMSENKFNEIEDFFIQLKNTLGEKEQQQYQFEQLKAETMLQSALYSASNKNFLLARDIYSKYLTHVTLNGLDKFINCLIENNELAFAKLIIDGKHSAQPQTILNYRQAIVAQYYRQLALSIDSEYADKLKTCHVQFTQALMLKSEGKSACDLQNQLIYTLKNMLDKAFQAYYQRTYTRPCPKIFGKMCNFPAPITDFFKGKLPEQKLTQFFSEFNFNPLDPLLKQFLINIQPVNNPAYHWLDKLRKMRNDETHAQSYLPENPIVDGQVIDMMTFLPEVLIGVEKILIKLADTSKTELSIDNLTADRLLSFTQDSLPITIHALGLDDPQRGQAWSHRK